MNWICPICGFTGAPFLKVIVRGFDSTMHYGTTVTTVTYDTHPMPAPRLVTEHYFECPRCTVMFRDAQVFDAGVIKRENVDVALAKRALEETP